MFKAEFVLPGDTGRQIVIAETAKELVGKMINERGFPDHFIDLPDIERWFADDKHYRYIRMLYTIQRGPDRMTEYISF